MLGLKGYAVCFEATVGFSDTLSQLERQDPYRLFASSIDVARLAMSNAYCAAFEAYVRCSDLLRKHEWSQIDTEDVFEQLGLCDSGRRRATASQEGLQRMYADAQAEDLQADYLAGILLLFADDTLQRFAKGVLGVAPGLGPGYGAEFGTHRGKVRLTALLRAGTNAIRHVSEWDDYRWEIKPPGKVYPALSECKNDYECQIMKNIVVFQNVLGWGLNERIRDVQSMRILIQIDGRFGTDPPDYRRFERSLTATAYEIAQAKGRRRAGSPEGRTRPMRLSRAIPHPPQHVRARVVRSVPINEAGDSQGRSPKATPSARVTLSRRTPLLKFF